MNQTKILIVDDHKIVADSIGKSLEATGKFDVVGISSSGLDAPEMAFILQPDIILMDVNIPDISGMEVTRQILAMQPKIKIVAFSMHTSKHYVFGMLKSGASGYLLKTDSFSEVLNAIQIILSGSPYLSYEIKHLLSEYKSKKDSQQDPLNLLSERERDILKLIADGHTSQTISACINISAKTVDTHRNNLKKKLNINTIAGLTKFAIKNGLVDITEIQ